MAIDLREKIGQAKANISSEVFTTLTEDDSSVNLDAAIFHLRNMKMLNRSLDRLNSLEHHVEWLATRKPPTAQELAEARAYRAIWKDRKLGR